MKRKVLVMAAIIIDSQLYAQDSSTVKQLDEVIVTANRLPQKQSNTGKMVTVINQETLQRNAGVKEKNLYRRPNFTFNSVFNFEPIKGLVYPSKY